MLAQRTTDFLQHLRYAKRTSPHTEAAYQRDLIQFQKFLAETYELEKANAVQHFHVRSWIASLHEKKLASSSINRKIVALRTFFNFLQTTEVVKGNPVKRNLALKEPEKLPQFLKESQTENLFEEINFEEGFTGLTERLLLDLLYQTGCRRAEVSGIKEDDLEWSNRLIRVLGKGNKERVIPMSESLQDALRHYISEKSKEGFGAEKRLLVNKKGAPLSISYIYSTVKKYLTQTTTLKKKSPHVLRHTFATHLLNNGASIQSIKELLGHKSLAATQIYTHINIAKLKEIHKQNHPRG